MAKPGKNSQRYTPSGDGWDITAEKEFEAQFPNPKRKVPPLHIGKGPGLQPAPLPLLEADDVIVMLDGQPLASAKTIAQMSQDEKDANLHRSPVPRSAKVNGAEMGGTMATFTLSTKGFVTAGNDRDEKNKKAGVVSVDYLYEGSQTSGVPNNLLNQINFTLVKDKPRPADTFEMWDLKLEGDYDIRALVNATMQGDNYLDKQKLETFVSQVGERIRGLRDDFNGIKRTFFGGAVPPNNGSTSYTQVASAEEPDPTHQVVTKEYELVGLTYNK